MKCACGCGRETNLAPKTSKRFGWIQGEPLRFVLGHRGLIPAPPISQRYSVDVETGCWNWIGATNDSGYGEIRRNGRLMRAHRVVFEEMRGPIPAGLQLDHLCRNRRCVNPAHLEPVTNKENSRRGIQPKLTLEKAQEIRSKYVPWKVSTYVLAKEYGVSAQQIFRVIKGIDWT